ncbi:hypothetical protein FACS189497_12990 [Betaproteobacteria bacterium]|nr:hypothetical protein FACS189497_12990 [Betaproteobacteria bacterium]
MAAAAPVNVGIAVTSGDIYGNGDGPVSASGNGSPDTGSADKLNGNTVNINSGGSVTAYFLTCGGCADSSSGSAAVTNNAVNVNSGAGNVGNVFGGRGYNSAEVSNNHVTFDANYTGTVTNTVHGGISYYGEAHHNTVIINNGTFHEYVYGGRGYNGASSANNKVIITGGTFDGFYSYNHTGIFGNDRSPASSYGDVIISGGTFSANTSIYGGYSSNNNTVTISNEHGLSFTNLVDLQGDTSGPAGNTLNLKTPLTISGTFENFQTLNFYLPTTLATGGTLLTVTGSANINGSAHPPRPRRRLQPDHARRHGQNHAPQRHK